MKNVPKIMLGWCLTFDAVYSSIYAFHFIFNCTFIGSLLSWIPKIIGGVYNRKDKRDECPNVSIYGKEKLERLLKLGIHLSNVLTDHFSNSLPEKTTKDIPLKFSQCPFKNILIGCHSQIVDFYYKSFM